MYVYVEQKISSVFLSTLSLFILSVRWKLSWLFLYSDFYSFYSLYFKEIVLVLLLSLLVETVLRYAWTRHRCIQVYSLLYSLLCIFDVTLQIMRMDEYTCKGEQSKIFTMMIGKTDSDFFFITIANRKL